MTAFRAGGDIHKQTASIIFGVAGGGRDERDARAREDHQLRDDLRPGRARAEPAAQDQLRGGQGVHRDLLRAICRHPGIPRFAGGAFAREQGYVQTIFGRKRFIPEVQDRNFNTRAFGERMAQNSPLQGSAADLIKIAMLKISDRLPHGWPWRAHAAAGARRTGVRGAG